MLVSQLRNALASLKPVTESRGTLPVLRCVLIESRDGGTRLSATNLKQYRTIQLPDAWPLPRTLLDAEFFSERLRSLPEGELQISETSGGIRVASSTSKLSFVIRRLADTSAFPAPIPLDERFVLRIDGPTLSGALKRVLYAASSDDTRAHLHGVRLELEPGFLRAVTTDGHRLAVTRVPADHAVTAEVFVPLHGAALLSACSEGEIKLVWGADSLTAIDGETTTTIRLTDAAFPPWRAVAGKLLEIEPTHTIPRVEWLASARALGGIREKSGGLITARFGQDSLSLHAESADHGEGEDSVTCTTRRGGDVCIGFETRYLVEAIGSADADNADVVVSGELDPVAIRGATTTAIVMPRRI